MMHYHQTPNDQTLEIQIPENNNVAGHCSLFGLNECQTISESNIGVPLEGKSSIDPVDASLGFNVNDQTLEVQNPENNNVAGSKISFMENKEVELVNGTKKLEVSRGNISLYVDLSGGANSDPLAGVLENSASEYVTAKTSENWGPATEDQNHPAAIFGVDLNSTEKNCSESAELRERKKSKYLTFPFVDMENKDLPNETIDPNGQEVEAEKDAGLSAGSHSHSKTKFTRFQKQWTRKFVNDSSVCSNPKLINASVADLLSKLRYTAKNCLYSNRCKNFDIPEWFFSKFRISAYHDESICEMQYMNPQETSQTLQGTAEKKKKEKPNGKDKQKKNKSIQKIVKDGNSGEFKDENAGVSGVKMNIATDGGIVVKEKSGEIGPPTPNGMPAPKKRKRQPKESKDAQNNRMTGIPDLNGNGITSNFSLNDNVVLRNVPMENSGRVVNRQTKRQKKTDTADVNLSNPRLSTVPVELKLSGPIAVKVGISASLLTSNPAEKEVLASLAASNPAKPNTTAQTAEKEGLFASQSSSNPAEPNTTAQIAEKQGLFASQSSSNPAEPNTTAQIAEKQGLFASQSSSNPAQPNTTAQFAEKQGLFASQSSINPAEPNTTAQLAEKQGLSAIQAPSKPAEPNTTAQFAEKQGLSASQAPPKPAEPKTTAQAAEKERLFASLPPSKPGGPNTTAQACEKERLSASLPSTKPTEPNTTAQFAVKQGLSAPAEPNTTAQFAGKQGLSAPAEPPKKRKRRTKKEMLEAKSSCNNNGETRGAALLLSFAPGVPLPPKEVLVSTFCRFGPLIESEIYSAQDVGTAQVMFIKSTDAAEAVKILGSSNPFGATLVSHRLKVLPAATPARAGVKLPVKSKLPGPSAPAQAPPIDFMRQNLERMTSMLEKSGHNLSPEMRAKLECEIKSLLKKVNSLPGSSSL